MVVRCIEKKMKKKVFNQDPSNVIKILKNKKKECLMNERPGEREAERRQQTKGEKDDDDDE